MRIHPKKVFLSLPRGPFFFILLFGAAWAEGGSVDWPDWRGPRRDALRDDVPEALPAEKRLLWARTLTGPGMSGMAVDAGCIVVTDKDRELKRDVFRCLDADTARTHRLTA